MPTTLPSYPPALGEAGDLTLILNNIVDKSINPWRLRTDAILEAGSISIGAVKIEDGASTRRVTVKNVGGSENAMCVYQVTQPLPIGAATEDSLLDVYAAVLTGASESTLSSSVVVLGQIKGILQGLSGSVATEFTLAALKTVVDTLDTTTTAIKGLLSGSVAPTPTTYYNDESTLAVNTLYTLTDPGKLGRKAKFVRISTKKDIQFNMNGGSFISLAKGAAVTVDGIDISSVIINVTSATAVTLYAS